MKEGTSMGLERKPIRSSSYRDNTTSDQDGAPKGPAEREVQQQHEDIAGKSAGRVAHDIAYASAKEIGADVLILGEPNKNTVRGSDWIKDRKGDVAILFLNKRIVGNIPTFRRGDSTSYIDVTCSTQNIARKVKNWKVLEKENLSDYAYIFFEHAGPKKTHNTARALQHTHRTERGLPDLGLTEARKPLHEQYSKIIKEAYRNSTRRVSNAKPAPYWWNEAIDDKRRQCTSARRVSNPKPAPYWWNEAIDDKRRQCTSARRYLTRVAKKPIPAIDKMEAENRYRMLKRELCKLIRQEKRNQWVKLCNTLEEDIWGDGYRIATRELCSLVPYSMPAQRKLTILRELFSTHTEQNAGYQTNTKGILKAENITIKELDQAVENIKIGKAPGIDGIPPKA
ncbi:hypothetical protein QE152_g40061, partial [Popillia japonica]